MEIKVSVIIPTYNRNEVLANTIQSVLKQKFDGWELIVVDQTQKHDSKTQEFLNKYKNKKFSYYLITPPSLPVARNFGLLKAKGEIVLFLDDDVILEPELIKAHWESYKREDVVSVVGRIKEESKPVSETLMYFRKTGFGAGNFNYTKEAFAETAQGCNMSFKKNILEKIGGFDTNYIGNAIREESDVSYRLRRLGYQTLFNPRASLFHLVSLSGGCREERPTYENYIQYRNETLFFLRHRPKIYLPYFLGGHLYRYVFRRDLFRKKKVLSRLEMFIKGFILGTWVYFFPQKQRIAYQLDINKAGRGGGR